MHDLYTYLTRECIHVLFIFVFGCGITTYRDYIGKVLVPQPGSIICIRFLLNNIQQCVFFFCDCSTSCYMQFTTGKVH